MHPPTRHHPQIRISGMSLLLRVMMVMTEHQDGTVREVRRVMDFSGEGRGHQPHNTQSGMWFITINPHG